MPFRPKHPCAHPGCPELVESGQKYCEKHKPLHKEDGRSAAKRGYDSKWRKFRKRYLEANPLCAECMRQGMYVKATDVDHIKPLRDFPELKYEISNLQPLCHRHHSEKTQREDRNPEYRY